MGGFDGAIFDLDGTLLDSMWVWSKVDETFLSRRGLPVELDYLKAISCKSFREAAAYTVKRFGLAETADALMAEWETLAWEAYSKSVPLKPGAREYLRLLRARGVRLGIATSCIPRLAAAALSHNGIGKWFDTVVYTSEVNRGKEFPDVYLLAAKRLGLPPGRCVVFEDLAAPLAGAKAGGFQTCGVDDAHAAQDKAGIRETADRFIKDFTELLEPCGQGVCKAGGPK